MGHKWDIRPFLWVSDMKDRIHKKGNNTPKKIRKNNLEKREKYP